MRGRSPGSRCLRGAWRTTGALPGRSPSTPFDLGVLAGYMLIVERELVEGHTLLNLHPALPDGPAGVWQAVIRQLIREGAEESGVMVHLAIPRWTRGLRSPTAATRSATPSSRRCARRSPRRRATSTTMPSTRARCLPRIRARGVEREAPLLAAAIAEFASGALRVQGARVVDAEGRTAPPADVTARVEAQLASR